MLGNIEKNRTDQSWCRYLFFSFSCGDVSGVNMDIFEYRVGCGSVFGRDGL